MNLNSVAAILIAISGHTLAGDVVTYQANNQDYQGYWSKVSDDAPLVLLVHDWDGLTEYEEQRAEMLNKMGDNVFAVDLFGKGVRPTKLRRQATTYR